MSGITVDVSEIRQLAHLLAVAADAARDESEEALREVAMKVAAEARSNASGFADTGELPAGAVQLQVSGSGARIYADVRQAFFLEYGSPNTGAPRPWLSGPAERGSTELLKRMAKIAEPW